MLRKPLAAIVLLAALALGSASATSLGTFDDVTFAASDVPLRTCTLDADAITLVPELPSADALLTDPLVDTATALLGTIDIDLTSLAPDCINDETLDVLILGASDVIAVTTIDPATAVDGLLSLDVSAIAGITVPDVTEVEEVRLVLTD